MTVLCSNKAIMLTSFQLQLLGTEDIERLLIVERAIQLFSPWTRETFETCFKMHCQVWGWVSDQQVIGFIVVLSQMHIGHILNLAILPAYQHQGLGYQLLQHVMTTLSTQGVQNIYLEVRASNEHAILLYKKAHFHYSGLRKAYYPLLGGQYEDALLFEWKKS